ncbi:MULTISPECIES: D-alanyl-D-alanine carboxypeptidase/D-alanyl-D-alanine endopeptidase [Variovorax]|jgi:serine-type D-Ala-D-Ala carboxypeptidase/endopeptidase (penicillin-binding protein 4)|uniref:D-alanyl-D-alanine carboxypeptidase/D-alanyl-D-alanine endopeptidase n=2 Tax=Comamonadaceae TaxID=80864 RepID=UPI00086D452F|nr:D-alanyl-D-alanine carboxypeptidase/D-alanyl-D-alanine-endopeptidase [Variovorax sp.]ODU14869.1 MAG: D-alanyl-D-alanine carboxypeptidase/D-alanyl-D-alanine-endopeptidase [Variovorax sp. SCN 67-85]ODV26203.1 MAG: D-alanyl-D-alanine carboxypeptidase/D-alanyl-D-alanine-endopeptidase [Variovorax sp. SCN 67-20]OJZ03713.1 MAG: D-alanyl-D-alanine carboxypeptidase/D-alanyl-D-alanine-endopeptidase [Variovorax sp. 67-131]
MPFAARTSPRLSPRAAGALISLAMLAPAGALAQQAFPSQVDAALARAKVPREAVTMLVADADGSRPPRLAWRTQVPVNPASIMKLVTTYAALDLLGPAYNWTTPVYTDGTVSNGVLNGNLYIKGQGDPKLVLERMWLLLRHVQGLGITTVNGDIVIDRSAFENTVEGDPAAFDGEPLRPYNASPDALLVNFKSVNMSFAPDRAGQFARVNYEPPLASVAMPATVPLVPGECGDWRTALRADFADVNRIRFNGGFPAGCGERSWAVAYADPRTYSLRAIGGMWAEMGGRVGGQMREGRVPAGLKPAFEFESPPLAEVVRDINKYSNNVMAQQLFLTIGLTQKNRGTFEASRTALGQWWRDRIGTGEAPPVFENGSGLSRDERISAAALGKMLQVAWRSPVMPELVSSLPAMGVDGTLKKRTLRSGGSAHLKTGTLRDASGVAGFVDGASGRRYVLVAIANAENAVAARAAFDALVDWASQD